MRKKDYKVALICPVYNEEEVIETFVTTVEKVLEPILEHIEIVFIDDGSKDRSVEIIEKLMETDERLALIKLSRNFGKEAAMSAALDLCDADAVVPIDVDLQDPPEVILKFVDIWLNKDVDMVYGMRVDRSADTDTKRVTSGGFYYVFNKLSSKVKIPENVGDFRLIDAKIVQTLRNLQEGNRFMKGLYAWPGFKSESVPYVRPERVAGTTKWNYWKLWNFALDGIVSFSSLPLRVWSYIGAGVGGLALLYMIYIFFTALFTDMHHVPGYASLMCVVLFLGSVQLISIGVIGEYLGRVSEEVKKRPVYVVSKVKGQFTNRLIEGYQRAASGVVFKETEEATKSDAAKSESAKSEVSTSSDNSSDKKPE